MRWRFVEVFVYLCVGLSVCWWVGGLVRLCVCLCVCWCVGLRVCVVCWCVGLLICWCVGSLVCWFGGVLVWLCVGVSRGWRVEVFASVFVC